MKAKRSSGLRPMRRSTRRSWTIFGLMRYRSRRDMMKLVMDPAFMEGHPDKLRGTLATFSFPAQRIILN